MVKNPRGRDTADLRHEQKLPFSDAELRRMYDACETKYVKQDVAFTRVTGDRRTEVAYVLHNHVWTGQDVADFISVSVYLRNCKPRRGQFSRALTSVKLQATVCQVKIRNFVHKGLKKLYAEDVAKGVPPDTVDKLRKMLAFLDDMQDPEELRALPAWKVHTLTGDRKGTWSLSVTRNRRLTFCIETADREIYDLNLEDYH
jgi:proteic killer suppression protein